MNKLKEILNRLEGYNDEGGFDIVSATKKEGAWRLIIERNQPRPLKNELNFITERLNGFSYENYFEVTNAVKLENGQWDIIARAVIVQGADDESN